MGYELGLGLGVWHSSSCHSCLPVWSCFSFVNDPCGPSFREGHDKQAAQADRSPSVSSWPRPDCTSVKDDAGPDPAARSRTQCPSLPPALSSPVQFARWSRRWRPRAEMRRLRLESFGAGGAPRASGRVGPDIIRVIIVMRVFKSSDK